MAVQVDILLFFPVLALWCFFFCLGFRFKIFGMLGGMMFGLMFAFMTANNAQLTTGNPAQVLMSFSVVSTNFLYGSLGIMMAFFGFMIAIFYVRLQ